MLPEMARDHMGAHPAAQRPVVPIYEPLSQRSPYVISRHPFSLPQTQPPPAAPLADRRLTPASRKGPGSA
jgi:hypothetical protein